MGQKPKGFLSSLKGFLSIVALVLGIIVYVLQIRGYVDFVPPIMSFLTFAVPIYGIIIGIGVLVGVCLLAIYVDGRSSPSIPIDQFSPSRMDNIDRRAIAVAALTPITAEELVKRYQYWCAYSLIQHGLFKDEIDTLEQARCLEFKDGKWMTTPRALEYLKKYHPLDVPE